MRGRCRAESRKATANPIGLLPILMEAILKHVPVTQTIDNPTDEQLFDRRNWADRPAILRCPVCGLEFSHVQAVYTLLGGDESGGLYRDSYLVACETSLSQKCTRLPHSSGDLRHRWDVVFQQHEDHTFVRIGLRKILVSAPALKERRH